MNVTAARVILQDHGIDPTADADELTLVIEATGWRLRLQRSQAPSRRRRQAPWWRAEATHPTSGAVMVVSGPTARHVLVRVLGQILEREA